MQGGVRLVVETHMQEFSGKRQRFPENGVQDSKICWRSDSLPSWFQLVLSQFFFSLLITSFVSRPCNLKI